MLSLNSAPSRQQTGNGAVYCALPCRSFGKQAAFGLPSRRGCAFRWRIYGAFFEEVYPYIGKEDMDQRSYALTVRGLPNDTGAFLEPGVYQFDEGNPLRLKTMEVQSDRLVYDNNRGSVILPFVPGQSISAPYPGWPEVPALVSAGFVRENVLRIRCHVIGNTPCGFDMLLVKKDGTLTVQCRKSFDTVTVGYDGVATGSAITCP